MLVVDDVRQNREVLSQLLAGIGCHVTLTEGGLEALEKLRAAAGWAGSPLPPEVNHPIDEAGGAHGVTRPTWMPDIVFMDIRMPDIDGPEVVEKFTAEFGRGRTKLVAISASVFEHEQQGYLKAGFDAFIGKPFKFEEICDCLKRLLNIEFRYAQEPEQAATAPALDPESIQLPSPLLTQLREAAARYSVTRLEQAIEVLEKDGETGKTVAAHLRAQIRGGDLDAVSSFLEKVKERQR